MSLVLPREEEVEKIFSRILSSDKSCERLLETFYDHLCDDNMYKKRRKLFFCDLFQQADNFFILTHKNEILFNLCA